MQGAIYVIDQLGLTIARLQERVAELEKQLAEKENDAE